ncbi:hypothetical protein HNP33_000495 [Comamonas odontotermitis]|uniref:DNA-binding protein n=1 Tax=Comamonas odontotermitis TaxID=379895 RepID=A0ABR6RBE9_9BURK|nr:hypothetical protein [Comamonas odontotermitis]
MEKTHNKTMENLRVVVTGTLQRREEIVYAL